MSEVNMYQQRRYIVARALISAAMDFLQTAQPDLLEEIGFDELPEVDACVAGLIDVRLSDDIALVLDIIHNTIDPEALPLSVDITGTEFQETEPPWTDDNYYDSIRAGIDPGTGLPIEESDEPHPY